MARRQLSAIVAAAVIALSTTVLAQGQLGTAAEAKAMLEKAVIAVKADKGLRRSRISIARTAASETA
jgi:serine protease inhibitor ecotin